MFSPSTVRDTRTRRVAARGAIAAITATTMLVAGIPLAATAYAAPARPGSIVSAKAGTVRIPPAGNVAPVVASATRLL